MQQLGKMEEVKSMVFLREIYREGSFSSVFLGSTIEEDVHGRGKGISFCINFDLTLQRRFRDSVKMEFLLDAKSSEPLNICFASDILGTMLEGRGLEHQLGFNARGQEAARKRKYQLQHQITGGKVVPANLHLKVKAAGPN